MGKNLYVGNLPWNVTSEELEEAFSAHGGVISARVITDRETGRSRGFGFVEMESEEGAEKAIEALNTSDFKGRRLTVNEARDKRAGGGGGGSGYGGGAGGYGGSRDRSDSGRDRY